MLRAAARRSAGIWCRAGADGAAALQGSAAACRAPAHAMTVRHASMFAAAMLSPSAAVAARRACGWPLQHGRGMSYFSGSHFDSDHMRDAKNPHLPEDDAAADAAVRIFGTAPVSNPHQRSIRKLLNAPLKGAAKASWYPPELRHNVHGYVDPFKLRRDAQLGRLKRRGKGPPKKGQGKRSKKK